MKSRFGHITKEGPATVRRLVTEAAWQAIRRDAGIRSYFDQVCRGDRGRRKIALVATAHRLGPGRTMLCDASFGRHRIDGWKNPRNNRFRLDRDLLIEGVNLFPET